MTHLPLLDVRQITSSSSRTYTWQQAHDRIFLYDKTARPILTRIAPDSANETSVRRELRAYEMLRRALYDVCYGTDGAKPDTVKNRFRKHVFPLSTTFYLKLKKTDPDHGVVTHDTVFINIRYICLLPDKIPLVEMTVNYAVGGDPELGNIETYRFTTIEALLENVLHVVKTNG